MFDKILWHVHQKKTTKVLGPKNVIRKPTILLNISKWKFHLYHVKLSKRNKKRESSTFFLFDGIYFVTLCFGRC